MYNGLSVCLIVASTARCKTVRGVVESCESAQLLRKDLLVFV